MDLPIEGDAARIAAQQFAQANQPVQSAPEARSSVPQCVYLTHAQAQEAFSRLRARLPGTAFDNARPSEVCGLVQVQFRNGSVAYTDPTGRYLLLAFAFDTHAGQPADMSQAVEVELDRRMTFPQTPIEGVFPGSAPAEDNGQRRSVAPWAFGP